MRAVETAAAEVFVTTHVKRSLEGIMGNKARLRRVILGALLAAVFLRSTDARAGNRTSLVVVLVSVVAAVPAFALHSGLFIAGLAQGDRVTKEYATAEVTLGAIGIVPAALLVTIGATIDDGQPAALSSGIGIAVGSAALLGHGIWALRRPDGSGTFEISLPVWAGKF